MSGAGGLVVGWVFSSETAVGGSARSRRWDILLQVRLELRANDSEQGARAADLTARAGGPNAEERVLHDIVDIADAGERALHIGARGAAVRIDLFSEPAGLIGGGRHRDDAMEAAGKGAWIKRGVSGDVVRDVHVVRVGACVSGWRAGRRGAVR